MTNPGYDTRGFDAHGYNSAGWDAAGFDINGFDRDGYDRDGFDRRGYDRAGYDVYGYDSSGTHRSGRPATRKAPAEQPPTPARAARDPQISVAHLIVGGMATVAVAALAAGVTVWALQALAGNTAEYWQRIGVPVLPSPGAAAVVGGVVGAIATAVALVLLTFVAEGRKFFSIASVLAMVAAVIWFATRDGAESTWGTWLVAVIIVVVPGTAIRQLAPTTCPRTTN